VQIPAYLEKQSELKAKGIEEVAVVCVDEPSVHPAPHICHRPLLTGRHPCSRSHVMSAWGRDQKIQGTMLKFFADPEAELTSSLGLILDDAKCLTRNLGNARSKRFAMIVDHGVVTVLNVSCTPDDPAGDNDPSASNVDNMLSCC